MWSISRLSAKAEAIERKVKFLMGTVVIGGSFSG